MECKKNNAIILSNCGIITSALTHKDVRKFSDLICKFIKKYVDDKNLCLGLRMSHNVYLPSLILSLQELQHAFIFLSRDNVSQRIVEELGISWGLSFKTSENVVDTITLGNVELFLEKYPIHTKKYEDVYYIMRTSGTTGQYKFVKVKRFCIESNINSLSRIFKISQNDVIYFGTPLTFDPSMVELLLALKNKACLLITDPEIRINSTALYKTLFHPKNGVTFLQIVPSLFLRWNNEQINCILKIPLLKILALGGEPFPETILDRERSVDLRIFNLYGITEVSCWASVCEVDTKNPICIGDPLDDTLIEVRDDFGCKIIEGEGEIYIGSGSRVCLVDDEENQKEVIFRATGDFGTIVEGKIYYKGRTNDVFKRLGHKIHLSNIEDLIQKSTALNVKCVWSEKYAKLLMFFIMERCNKDTKDKVVDKLRVKLLHSLPKHYFPDYVDVIRRCPITGHGKLDKNTLEQIYLNRDNKDKNLTCCDMFRSLICKYFGFGTCQLDDFVKFSFFDIGGSSVLAVQLLNEFSDELGFETPPELVAALFNKDIKSCFDSLTNLKPTFKRKKIGEERKSKQIKKEINLKIKWSYNFYACVDSSPLVFDKENQTIIAVGSFSHIFAIINGATGAEISKFILPDVIESKPCLSPCKKYLFTGCFDGKMYCLDWQKQSIKWTYSTDDRIKCEAILCQNSSAILFGSYDKHVHCVKIEDGSKIFKIFISESIISTPVLRESKIFLATISGTCMCLSDDGTICWSYKTGGPVFGALCIYQDFLMLPVVQGKIICLSVDGQIKWKYDCGSSLYSTLVMSDDLVVFGCHDGNLYFLKVGTTSANLITKVYLGDKISTTPCIAKIKEKNCVIVSTDCGNLLLVDFEGVIKGEIQLSGQVFSSPQFKDRIYVGCRDNNLYSINYTY